MIWKGTKVELMTLIRKLNEKYRIDKNCAIIKQKFLDRQYKEEVPDEQIMKVDRIQRKELLTCKQKKPNKNRIPLSITY